MKCSYIDKNIQNNCTSKAEPCFIRINLSNYCFYLCEYHYNILKGQIKILENGGKKNV